MPSGHNHDFLAIFLGAKDYPSYPNLSNSAFGDSHDAIVAYLQDYLHLRAEEILDLFDDYGNVIELNKRVSLFLRKHREQKNILVFYVGHGGFLSSRDYYLAVHNTAKGDEHTTGLRISVLAETLTKVTADRSLFLFLDCCFSGEAVGTFQTNELPKLVDAKTYDAFPEVGTTLLVAASKDEPAISKSNSAYTMFSESLLEVLKKGVVCDQEKISLRCIAENVRGRIKRTYGQDGVLPEIHSPRQKGNNIADACIFPNAAFVKIEPIRPSALRVTPAEQSFLSVEAMLSIERIENLYRVPTNLISDDLLHSLSDDERLANIHNALKLVDKTNSILAQIDSEAVTVRRGNLAINARTPFDFWVTLFDEVALQGHRTTLILLCVLRSIGLPTILDAEIESLAKQVISNFALNGGDGR